MALVITVAQQKGGAGKTMLVANLAACLAPHHRVTVLDIDPQHTLSRWHALRTARADLAVVGFAEVSGWRVRGELARLEASSDILVVDTPPQIDSDAARAIRAASLVLVPVQPSMPDLWAADATLKIAAAEKRKLAVILTRAPAKSALRSAVEADLAARGIPLLPEAMGDRRAYAQAFAAGMGVADVPKRSAAAIEMDALAHRILETAR